MKIAFFGTPPFAATCLRELHNCDHHDVIGVVTAPDRKAGRGQQVQPSAVKVLAKELGYNILQPTNLKDEKFTEEFGRWEADLAVVVAFRMLPEIVWNKPRLGSINLHASLLPQLRGAAPIQWAIIHGFEESGVTTFRLNHSIDTGEILMQEQVSLSPQETAGSLHDKLLTVGKEMLIRTLDFMESGMFQSIPQEIKEPGTMRDAPKLNKNNTRIDWTRNREEILRQIRGLFPHPMAWTSTPFGDFKIATASVHDVGLSDPNISCGETRKIQKSFVIKCADGWLELIEIIPPGKKQMTASAWLNGLQVDPGHWGG